MSPPHGLTDAWEGLIETALTLKGDLLVFELGAVSGPEIDVMEPRPHTPSHVQASRRTEGEEFTSTLLRHTEL